MRPPSPTERLISRLTDYWSSRSVQPDTLWRALRRTAVDPLVNALGRLAGWLLLLSGSGILFWFHDALLSLINPSHLQKLVPESQARQENILPLLKQFKRLSDRDCCFLILFSHPEAGKKMRLFSLALYQHVFHIGTFLYRSGWARSYPRLLIAVDPFALDSLDWFTSSFYAGIARTLHISLDRQPSRLGWLQRALFLGKSAPTEAGFRFIAHLKPGHAVALAQAGGEPRNSRLLYTAREFVTALSKHEMDFDKGEFLARLAEEGLLPPKTLADVAGQAPQWTQRRLFLEVLFPLLNRGVLESGKISRGRKQLLTRLLLAAGISEARTAELCDGFEEEFKRNTPYRERLFNILLDRIIKPGIPLMLIPLWHDWDKETIQLENPEILWQTAPGVRERFYLDPGLEMRREPVESIARYAKNFTISRFPR
ncbi:MAG: hypothetical protein HY611_01275 [Elusimicrobia bacterium]|nr:hypothetical protein [Elusimicrobiota bacterium]